MDFPGHFEDIFRQLNHQRVHGQLCDCVIVVGNQRFQAHRSVLAASSTHFRALLSTVEGDKGVEGGGKEGDGGGMSVVELDLGVVTSEAFASLLDMIYTSTLTLGSSNVMDILLAASHLHLNSVVKACKHHLSARNFPTSPPSGWRLSAPLKQRFNHTGDQQNLRESRSPSVTVASSRQQRSVMLQQLGLSLVTSALEGSVDHEEPGVEAGLSVGRDGRVGTGGGVEQRAGYPTRPLNKWKCCSSPQVFQEERPSSRHRSSCLSEGSCRAGSLDSLKTDEGLRMGRGVAEEEEEVEEKYEAPWGGSVPEEVQVPTQSDSGIGGAQDDGGEGHTDVDEGFMVKVKVGEEGEEEEAEKMEVVEVKSEHHSSAYPDAPEISSNSPSPLEVFSDLQDEEPFREEKLTLSPLEPQPSTDPPADNIDGGESSSHNEGLDGLQDLGLSCILKTSSESSSGADGDSGIPNIVTNGALSEGVEEAGGSSFQDVDATNASPSSSVAFPVASVPIQQLLSGQTHSFTEAFFLQPNKNSLGGFLQGIRPEMGPSSLGSLSLQTSLPHSSRDRTTRRGQGRGLGRPSLRRIAPKVDPNSEVQAYQTDGSSSSETPGSAVPACLPLTRASEDVLSKCKKAQMEHNVLVVEGARKYACRICSKTFLNLTDCRKHIRVHTGEKPYVCGKCGKHFSQSSHLYKHSKTTCLRWQAGPLL